MTKALNAKTLSSSSKVLGSTGKRLPPNAGKGRKLGVPNRLTRDIRTMVETALHEMGGEDYLIQQARQNPVAFLSLVGKLIPTHVRAEVLPNFDLAARLETATRAIKHACLLDKTD